MLNPYNDVCKYNLNLLNIINTMSWWTYISILDILYALILNYN